MGSFDYEIHIDEMMRLEALRAEYDAWQMEREHERERQEIETLSPLMCELFEDFGLTLRLTSS